MRKAIKTLVILVALGVAGYFGYQYYLGQTAETPVEAPIFAQIPIARGNLSKSVTGTGTLSIGETQNVLKGYAVTVSNTLVKTGDVVQKDDPLVAIDQDSLEITISTLQEELSATESDMASISNNISSSSFIKMPLDGRVKEIYLEAGRQVEDIMAERGSIALLSLDGMMYVEIDAVPELEITTVVKVQPESMTRTIDGTVREIKNGKAKITFSDGHVLEGEEVTIQLKDAAAVSAAAHINLPYYLTTAERGYVHSIQLEVNKRRWEGNRIAYLTNKPVSSDYSTLESTRTRLTERLNDAKDVLAKGTIRSPIDGIVSAVTEASVEESVANTILSTLYVGDKKEMIVTVDELDITNVQVGQTASIVMDAIDEQAYSAVVSHVSQIGTAESGVTVYDVTLAIDGDSKLKIGMNGTATILIEEVTDVLLVPLMAMNTSREGQYVWLYDETMPADSGEPGVRTMITTGLSDENFAQVLTGLNEGDIVIVTRSSDGGSRNPMFGGGNMMFMGGGGSSTVTTISMPVGGGAPGGGNRQGAPSR